MEEQRPGAVPTVCPALCQVASAPAPRVASEIGRTSPFPGAAGPEEPRARTNPRRPAIRSPAAAASGSPAVGRGLSGAPPLLLRVFRGPPGRVRCHYEETARELTSRVPQVTQRVGRGSSQEPHQAHPSLPALPASELHFWLMAGWAPPATSPGRWQAPYFAAGIIHPFLDMPARHPGCLTGSLRSPAPGLCSHCPFCLDCPPSHLSIKTVFMQLPLES